VISEDKTLKAERIPRHRSIDGAPAGSIGLESLPSATAANFVLLPTADEIVLIGIEGEQDPETTIGIDMKYDEVAIVFGFDLNLGAVAREKATVIADPQTDRRVVLGGIDRLGRRASEHQRKEQRGDHGTSQQPRFQRGKYDGTLTRQLL
jgi:hypothetical protein